MRGAFALLTDTARSQGILGMQILAPVEIVLSKSQVRVGRRKRGAALCCVPLSSGLQAKRVLSTKIIDYWGSEANTLGTQISAMHRQ